MNFGNKFKEKIDNYMEIYKKKLNQQRYGRIMKKICVLGSTGSIGRQSLEVIGENPEIFQVTDLVAGKNLELLEKQILEFNPKQVYISDENHGKFLREKYSNLSVYTGEKAILDLIKWSEADVVINGLVGIMGLEPTIVAIEKGMDIALANKETLVAGGEIVMALAEKNNVNILPVDSEHSAIFQCLQGNSRQELNKIILTASGGPFRKYSLKELEKVTVEDALNHPNWAMGSKITVDSATLMNKGLEVIEAKWLFNLKEEEIDVVVHPQSILHSAVEFKDGGIIGQMGAPDMRLPIAYALTYPHRIKLENSMKPLWELGSMTFEKVDYSRFSCIKLAIDAMKMGESYPVVLNSANEVLVAEFIKGNIGFLDIPKYVEMALNSHNSTGKLSLESILEIDNKTRKEVYKNLSYR